MGVDIGGEAGAGFDFGFDFAIAAAIEASFAFAFASSSSSGDLNHGPSLFSTPWFQRCVRYAEFFCCSAMEEGFTGEGRWESQPGETEGSRTLDTMIWNVCAVVLVEVLVMEGKEEL